jgi:hypothetical protein
MARVQSLSTSAETAKINEAGRISSGPLFFCAQTP